jgi:hypothetical protein
VQSDHHTNFPLSAQAPLQLIIIVIKDNYKDVRRFMATPKKKISQIERRKILHKQPIKNVLQKQMLVDLEKRISLNVGSFLVLSEEGDPTQIAMAHQKAKSDFLKFGPEMHRIAQQVGGEVLYFVSEYLESIDIVLHTAEFLDDEKVSHCFRTTQKLGRVLKTDL